MFLTSHDGKCCGIATIYSFHYAPSAPMSAFTQENITQYKVAYPNITWYGPMPKETCLQRFKRHIEYRERIRESGIIEVVLTTEQLSSWKKTLEELQFKESCRNYNSNSGNTIVIFHRLSGAEGVDKITAI